MAETFIYTSVYRVLEGKSDEFLAFAREVTDLVQEREPDMIHFGIYVDEDSREATTVQVHRTADNFALHMDLIAPLMARVHELVDLSDMSIRIFGRPSEAILAQMRSLSGAGASVSISEAASAADHLG